MSTSPKIRLDVWLRFDSPDDEEASHEANVYVTEHVAFGRDMLRFIVEWYGAGPVQQEAFDTYGEARAWLEAAGYQDFTTEPVTDYQAWLDAHDYDERHADNGDDNVPPLTLADGYLNVGNPGTAAARTCGCCGVEFAWD